LAALIFLMLQITTCAGILDHSVQYGLWKIGRALPMYYGVRQLKVIFWKVGEHTTGINILVISLWIFVFAILSLVSYSFELKNKREKYLRRENRKSISYNNETNSYSSDERFNNTTLETLKTQGVSDSMENCNFTEEEYYRSTETFPNSTSIKINQY